MDKTDKSQLYKAVDEKLKNNFESFIDVSDFIFNHPELGGEEFVSSEYLCNFMKLNEFKVEHSIQKLPTAFVAEYSPSVVSDHTTVIAFLAEYDALLGFGKDDGLGHACGHNWIAACMCGCAITLSAVADEANCIVRVIGTPAEETFGGKYDLIKEGIFKDVDLVFQAHLDEFTSIETLSLAMNSIEFDFHGIPAHSAQNPEKGVNALDAVVSMYNSINALRQHIKKDDRIHGIITSGGTSTNTVPDFAQCRFSIRSKTKAGLYQLRTKLINIAKGASLATGATLEYTDFENPCDDMINIPTFTEICKNHFSEYGYNDFIPEDQYPGSGSSDIGNVSYECPTVYLEFAPKDCEAIIVHDKSAMKLVNSKNVVEAMKPVILAYTRSAIDICLDRSLLQVIRKEHKTIIEKRKDDK